MRAAGPQATARTLSCATRGQLRSSKCPHLPRNTSRQHSTSLCYRAEDAHDLHRLSSLRASLRPSEARSSPLGIRSRQPPDSAAEAFDVESGVGGSSSSRQPDPEEEISDQDWELRTGRAIYILQETLPTFFDTGLYTAIDKATGSPVPPDAASSHHFHLPLLDTHGPLDFLASDKGKQKATAEQLSDNEEPVYSPNVRLEYTPPVPLPSPFPKILKVEGLQLYLASSSMVRHTMKTLYSDLAVTLTKVSVHTSPPFPPPSDTGASASSSPDEGDYVTRRKRKMNREKHVIVRQLVTGTTRVSGKQSEWEVESMYTFSPLSGLILKHTVNSIQPAPHLTVYDSLKFSMGKIFGFGTSEVPTPEVGVIGCRGKQRGRDD
ncbi:hypothetical protein FA15DRAFT_585528 [Coprinopsis marcescibilis]|uniref:Uncharacterized protein n=1 Tax=Coprinopsis marcescibilis TaxID=230819 RepID=A0A5C3L5W3_COPMA|nr:hypothetical protein FA15DRAFT_585528 [Coprinopsis marcescibilis]